MFYCKVTGFKLLMLPLQLCYHSLYHARNWIVCPSVQNIIYINVFMLCISPTLTKYTTCNFHIPSTQTPGKKSLKNLNLVELELSSRWLPRALFLLISPVLKSLSKIPDRQLIIDTLNNSSTCLPCRRAASHDRAGCWVLYTASSEHYHCCSILTSFPFYWF